MIILGINAYHADVSAVLLRDGELVAAVEEERFRRIKHCAGFPQQSIQKCLEMADLAPSNVDFFAVSRDPHAHLFRKALFAMRRRPSLDLIRRRVRNAGQVTTIAQTLAEQLSLDPEHVRRKLRWVEHHPAHLASTFFLSTFEEAAVCAVDGFGDFVSTSLAVGRKNRIDIYRQIFFPHSLGELYLAVTQYLGFPNYGDEFKVMGLAPYGKPDFVPQLRQLVALKSDGTFRLDLSFFKHWSEGDLMSFEGDSPRVGSVYSKKLVQLLGPSRRPGEPLEARHEAIAASLQVVFEEVLFHLLNALQRKTKLKTLCLAGGCAMNSVANGKIRERTPFEAIYVQPASADNGTALGAAYHVWHQLLGKPRGFEMQHGYWGPQFSRPGDLLPLKDLALQGYGVSCLESEELLCERTAALIAEGNVVGWFQGRMEWGARALGNRSIVADPRRSDMRSIINSKIKFREKFRPFAPSVLEESVSDYFVGAVPDPFMIQVYPVRESKRSIIPAVTHVDGSGRLQTVSRNSNKLYWKLIKAFETRTGVPVLLNTSFNENEPIVHKPSEALDCFLRTNMDVLVVGPYLIEKEPLRASSETPSKELVGVDNGEK